MASIDRYTKERLFALLRLGILGDEQYSRALFDKMTSRNWLDLYNLALEQGVLAFAYDGIRKLEEQYYPELDIKIQWAYNVSHIEKIFNKQLLTIQSTIILMQAAFTTCTEKLA